MQVLTFKEIDSTNTYGKEFLKNKENFHGTLITAEHQTAGRGRVGRSFASEGGLYFSLLLDDRNKNYPLTCAAAVAVRQVILEEFNIDLSIKWVNDLFYQGKKVCGILTEGIPDTGYVCGIGLNTKNTLLPPELHDIATLLPVEKTGLAEKIAQRILDFYENNTRIMPLYKDGLFLNCKVDVYQCGHFRFSGIATDINQHGNLIVTENETTHILSSGEISIKL